MRKIWNWIKKGFKAVGQFLKQRPLFLLGLALTWGVPIYLLNEQMALLQEVPQGIKITFTGCMVIFVIFLAVRKKLYLKIGEIKNVFTKEILLTITRGIAYGLAFGLLWGISVLSGKLLDWWTYSGISILLGAVFYLWDKWLLQKRISQ